MDSRELVSRRTDLSTFVVHLTRQGTDGQGGLQNLKAMIKSGTIQARNPYGAAVQPLKKINTNHAALPTQKVVCFTETPLEHLYLLLTKIDNRRFQFEPYGIAITKAIARKVGVNPVWYMDITPGHEFLTNSLNDLIEKAAQNFAASPIAKLTPFMEQMGTGPNYRKEFWWEREWRHAGDLAIPRTYIGIAPEEKIAELQRFSTLVGRKAKFIDPRWGLEEIIASLAK